jgi:DNA repair protein RecN (Recombination protein N)
MLQTLDIRDFVIVSHLELDLANGFTVLTGETGAGKSILLDALGIAMGEKADSSLIREGCSRAIICANFFIPDYLQKTINPWLDHFSFPLGEDECTVQLKRVIETTGRSKAYINGSQATLQQLRELGEQLVDIHGQHEHQLLLKPGAQRILLDRHANLIEQQEEVSSLYKSWQSAEKSLQLAKTAGQNLIKEKERLEWQLEELNVLAPQNGEWDEIQIEHSRLSNASELIEGTQSLIELLSDGEGAIIDQLAKAQNTLDQLVKLDNALSDAKEALEPATIQVSEASHTITKYLQKLDLDPERLSLVDSRLQEYYRLSKKLHCQPAELPNQWALLKEELNSIHAAQNIGALEKEVANALDAYLKSSKKLSKSRKSAAEKLSNDVTHAMQDLAMSGGKFVVDLLPLEHGNQYGLENIEFLVAGHPGVQPRAISKVASGGELARISLAIAVIASSASSVPTLIFDEVDAGIGGSVAQTVGGLLKKLGSSHQVLCVTHLPQVAAQGDQQWRVQKVIQNQQTLSDIQVLSRTERIQEVARMLGGATITDTTLRHARELLEMR